MTLFHLLRRPVQQTAALETARAAIQAVFPIPRKHLADLPFAVRDLSRMLTQERGALQQSYWSAPRFLAAYMHYFLPWNLHRLAWLLPQLPLAMPKNGQIVDLGSGPLTLPIALWCARPELRSVPLQFTCYDVANQPLVLGKQVLERLQGDDGLWQIRCERSPLDAAIAKHQGPVHAFFAGNVLNELAAPKQGTLEGRLAGIMGAMRKKLAPGGQILLVEPGTRLGGKIIALSRKGALGNGMMPLAPCPHDGPCPMFEQDQYQPGAPAYSGWCHFIHPVDSADPALVDLTKKARLEKDTLAISCLLLGLDPAAGIDTGAKAAFDDDADDLDALEALYEEMMTDDNSSNQSDGFEERYDAVPVHGVEIPVVPGKALSVRVVSDLIRLPQFSEPARYGCSAAGLVLLQDARVIYPGGGVTAYPVEDRNGMLMRDKKSTALFVRQKEESQQQKVRSAAKEPGKRKFVPSHGKAAETREKPRGSKIPGVKAKPHRNKNIEAPNPRSSIAPGERGPKRKEKASGKE